MKLFTVLVAGLFAMSLSAATPTNLPCSVLTKDNAITFNDYFSGEYVANVVQKAKVLDGKFKSKEPLCLVIASGGGSIDAGVELIENMNNLNRPVHTITLFAASMGFHTVQGIKGQRFITTDGTLMSHKARGGFYGEFPGQLESRYFYYLKRILRLDEGVVERTNGKFNAKTYASLIENEYWCDGQECINNGFADATIAPKCDDSLNGTYKKVLDRWMYMGHVIELIATYAICPLQTEMLAWNGFIDGKPVFTDDPNASTEDITTDYVSTFFLASTISVLRTLSVETAENIKLQITSKMVERNTLRKDIRKY